MKNIILIVGARPNFMKAFPVYEVLKNYFNLTLIHTGQHFDKKMSNIFFEQLKFPSPDIHLSLYKRTKAGDFDDKLYVNNEELLNNKDKVIEDLIQYQGELGQMGEIRDKLKKEFEKLKPDLVIVFGDVTSTLASGLAAKTLNIDLAHVESGLRSGDIKMPEEVNRILTDHISKYLFITEQSGVDNLRNSGITENVHLVGNTMIDTQKKYLQQALNTKYQETLGVKSRDYVLITLHRPSNVDDLDKLKEIFDDLEELSKTEKLVYPIHPRTKNNLEKLGYLKKIGANPNIILDEPLGYLEFTCLIANCKYVITDSGGIQEETTALDIPCFTLRENTERPSTLIKKNGTNQMIHKVNEIELKECKGSMELWDGKSSRKISNIINTSMKLKCNKQKIISFTLYGDNPLYLKGALVNLKYAKKIYPEWICRFYCDNDTVPKKIIVELECNGGQVVLLNKKYNEYNEPKFWRYYPFQDKKCEYFISRDCDSRIGLKEKLAVDQWIKYKKKLHLMHDNKQHGSIIMAGMFGGKGNSIPTIKTLIEKYLGVFKKNNIDKKFQTDQPFLAKYIFPLFKDDYISHNDEITQHNGKLNHIPFPKIEEPFVDKNQTFIGQTISVINSKPKIKFK